MAEYYTTWHGEFTQCKIISNWIEGPGWVYRSDGVAERYWSEKRRVRQVQVLNCNCGQCDRSQYSARETIYPEWSGGLPVDNRITKITGWLYKDPEGRQEIEEVIHG